MCSLEVHIRVASPPLYFPCNMGISIRNREELIANKMSLQELAEYLGKTDYFFFFNSLIVTRGLYTKTSLLLILLDETGSKEAICGAHWLSRHLSSEGSYSACCFSVKSVPAEVQSIILDN